MKFVFSDADWLKQYYDDELQYKGEVLAGTFMNVLYDLAEENQNWGPNFKKPVYIVQAWHDKLVSNARIEEFYTKIGTPSDKKDIKMYDTEHYVMSDGWIYEQVIADQVAFLNKLFKWLDWMT